MRHMKNGAFDMMPTHENKDICNTGGNGCHGLIPRFGLGDYICPPTGVMAMYNNVPCGKKGAVGFQNSTHGYVMPRPRQMLHLDGDGMAVRK